MSEHDDHKHEREPIWPNREERARFWQEMRGVWRGDPPTPEQRERMDEIDESQRREEQRQREEWARLRPRWGGQHRGDWRSEAGR